MGTKKRGNGEGTIFQRADGRWSAVITIGRNATGKQVRKTVYGMTRNEVAEKLTRLQGQKLDGTLSDAPRMILAGWLARWLDDYAAQSVRASTLASYRQIVKLHIDPHIGGVNLQKLHAVQVQGLYSKLQRAKKSPRLIQMVHAVLHRALGRAVKLGLVRLNACHAVERPRVPKHEIKPLEADQISKLLKAAEGDRLEALYVLAISTGMRQGELFGLKWQDIDTEAGTLSVRRTLLEMGKGFIENEPKTRAGSRCVSLPSMAVEALRDHRKRMLVEGFAGVEWVFCSSDGSPLRRGNVSRRSLNPILERAGIQHIRFHDLRHASASMLLSKGVHPKVVQERLGHSQIGITLDIYSHVLQGMDAKAASVFDDLLSPTGT